MVWASSIRPLQFRNLWYWACITQMKWRFLPWSYRPDRWRDGWRTESRVWQQIVMRAPSLLSSQQPTTSPPSHKAPSPSPACPWHAKASEQTHRRDKLHSAVFKTFWLGFAEEGLGVDFVKESKWGASECCCCSILICVCGCFLSGSFPCITP